VLSGRQHQHQRHAVGGGKPGCGSGPTLPVFARADARELAQLRTWKRVKTEFLQHDGGPIVQGRCLQGRGSGVCMHHWTHIFSRGRGTPGGGCISCTRCSAPAPAPASVPVPTAWSHVKWEVLGESQRRGGVVSGLMPTCMMSNGTPRGTEVLPQIGAWLPGCPLASGHSTVPATAPPGHCNITLRPRREPGQHRGFIHSKPLPVASALGRLATPPSPCMLCTPLI
jgi:hypothetical protein